MIKLFKKSKLIYVFAILAFSFSFTSSYLEAQESSKPKKQIKYKKARALQTSTAKKMAKVYEALEVVNEKGTYRNLGAYRRWSPDCARRKRC